MYAICVNCVWLLVIDSDIVTFEFNEIYFSDDNPKKITTKIPEINTKEDPVQTYLVIAGIIISIFVSFLGPHINVIHQFLKLKLTFSPYIVLSLLVLFKILFIFQLE